MTGLHASIKPNMEAALPACLPQVSRAEAAVASLQIQTVEQPAHDRGGPGPPLEAAARAAIELRMDRPLTSAEWAVMQTKLLEFVGILRSWDREISATTTR